MNISNSVYLYVDGTFGANVGIGNNFRVDSVGNVEAGINEVEWIRKKLMMNLVLGMA